MTVRARGRTPRRWAAAVVAAVALAGGLLAALPAPPALACSCIGLTDAEAFAQAEAVFTGRVVDYRPPPMTDSWSSADLAIWVFEVTEVHKGTVAQPRQEVASAVSGASCGLEIPEQRGTYRVYADVPSDGAVLHASLCGGTHAVAGAVGAGDPDRAGEERPVADDGNGAAVALGAGALIAGAGALLVAVAGLVGLVLWRRRP